MNKALNNELSTICSTSLTDDEQVGDFFLSSILFP